MPLISQQILSVLDGVSQQPDKMRAAGQAEQQINMYDSIQLGKTKRPPTRHIAKLSNSSWDPESTYIWAVNRDSSERYHVVVTNGTIQVFDANTGQQYPVLTPQGTGYLATQSPPAFTLTFDLPDTFVGVAGTLLSAHTSAEGVTWQLLQGQTPQSPAFGSLDPTQFYDTGYLFDSAELGQKDTLGPDAQQNSSGYLFNYPMPVANYEATVAIVLNEAVRMFSSGNVLVWARLQPVSNIANYCTGYFAQFNDLHTSSTAGAVTLWRQDSDGTLTQLGTTAQPGNVGTGATIGIQVTGNSIKALYNGTACITATDSTYGAPGYAALMIEDETNSDGSPIFFLSNWNVNYSTSQANPLAPLQNGFRFVTIQDTTIITNQTVTVEPNVTEFTPIRYPEALISITQADYGTNYAITLNGTKINYQTVAPTSPNARQQLTSDGITGTLIHLLTIDPAITGFTFEQFGSTIYITRSDHADFTLAVSDGLSDTAIIAVKKKVQAQTDLPGRAISGFVVEVQPDPDDKLDAAYYIYDDLGQPSQNGIWRECAAPGILTNFDNATMPWALTKLGNVVAGYPADGGPVQPLIADSGADITNYGGNQSVDYTPTYRWQLGSDAAAASVEVAAANSTTGQVVTMTYDVDGANIYGGIFATVTMTNNFNGDTAVAQYSAGESLINQQLTTTGAYPTNTIFSLTLNVSNVLPGSPDIITLHALNDPSAYPGLTITQYTATDITWNDLSIYPGSFQITVVVGSTTVHYTPPADKTAAQLAALIGALTFTGYTVTTNGDTNTFTPGSGGPPTITVTYAFNPLYDFHNGSLDLAPSSLIGYEISDLTAGSSGTVTGNTATSIIVSGGLTGGIRDTFAEGDQVSVSGPTGELFFVFQPIPWAPRGVGDDNTNPFPSLTYNQIYEVGYTSGRLILTSGENLIMSGADDVYDLFRTTVVSLLDSDRIDITANSQTVSDWHSIVQWAEGVWLFAANLQAQLPIQPALANSTVSIAPQTTYQSSPALRPLSMDRSIYFCRERTGSSPVTQVFTYRRIRFPFFGFIAQESTKPLPTYLAGSPLAMAGDPTLECMVVLTSAVPYQLYFYVFHRDEAQELQQESWSLWEFDKDATILAIDMLDGHLGLIFGRSDGTYLEDIDLQLALYNEV